MDIVTFLQINTAKGILDTILSVQPKESSGGKPGETREAIVYKIAEDMLRKLPRDYVPHEIKEALIRLGGLLPMNIFLRQEIDRMQKILSIGMLFFVIFDSLLKISVWELVCVSVFNDSTLIRFQFEIICPTCCWLLRERS